jgi:hypothetical protein
VCFAGDLTERDDTYIFPFIKNGHLLSYEPQIRGQPPNARVTTYKPQNGKEVLLSGSPMGLEKMLQNEFPQGIDEGFVRKNLIELLDGCLSSSCAIDIATDEGLRRIREHIKGKAPFLDFIRGPSSYCRENHWAVRFMIGDGSGGVTLKVFKGQLRPFEIRSEAEFLLWPDKDSFDAEKASLSQAKAEELYNEN